MTAIEIVSVSNYQDTILVDDTYYYVIVAGNAAGNSSISNCESVIVQTSINLPTLINDSPQSLNLTISIYVSDAFIFSFAYTDQYGIPLTDLSDQSYTWNRYNDEGIIIGSGAGTLIKDAYDFFILDFDTETREVGKYVIIATLDKDGYDSKNATITLNIVKRVFDVILSGNFNNNIITIEKGTYIEIGVNISDPTRGNIPLSGATVNLTIQEIWYVFTEKKLGIYNLTLNTDNYEFSGSSLTLSGEISIKKLDYETQTINITIIIKTPYHDVGDDDDDDDDDDESSQIPFGNYYLLFAAISIISLTIIKKRKAIFSKK